MNVTCASEMPALQSLCSEFCQAVLGEMAYGCIPIKAITRENSPKLYRKVGFYGRQK